jgi:hypothetical protein
MSTLTGIMTVDVHNPKNLASFCSRDSRCESVKHSKLFQLFIEDGVVTIIAKMNNAIYDRTRIAMILRIFEYQSVRCDIVIVVWIQRCDIISIQC